MNAQDFCHFLSVYGNVRNDLSNGIVLKTEFIPEIKDIFVFKNSTPGIVSFGDFHICFSPH